ncbi:hypothetical protein KEM56_002422 [Ascosphaera pollenicola]|nr:hypothetical protein KEM56_002422 [Ascosphaera pollenicola]
MASSSHEFVADEDEYIARMLADDARQSSLRYSSVGVDAFLSTRRPASALKPNTRFLRNILRDTDSHNSSIKRQTPEEQPRQRHHGRSPKTSDSHSGLSDSHSSLRHQGRRALNSTKRPLDAPDEENPVRRKLHRHSTHNHSPRASRHKHHANGTPNRNSSEGLNIDENSETRSRHHHRHRRHAPDHASKSTDKQSTQNTHCPHKQHPSRRQEADMSDLSEPPTSRFDEGSDTSDSLIGPLLPSAQQKLRTVTSRGRGVSTSKLTTNIDDHFDPGYDPQFDRYAT